MNVIEFYQNFYKKWLNKWVDVDGYYGAQCWDGAMNFSKELCGHIFNCSDSGYAKDIWEQRATNGILNYFNEVSLMQPGDICVFKESSSCPSSHIAIFHSDIDGMYGWFFGQNQGGIPVAYGGACYNLCKLPYADTYATAFRYKGATQDTDVNTNQNNGASLNNVPADFVKVTATFYPNCTIKIRNAPSTKGEDTGLVYKKGMSVIYDGNVIREGYIWISWIGASGVRRWMAAGEVTMARDNVPVITELWGEIK